MVKETKFYVKDGKWNISNTMLDYFINLHREIKIVSRCKIDKKQNYKFKEKN